MVSIDYSEDVDAKELEITELNDPLIDYVPIEMLPSIFVICASICNIGLQFAVPKGRRFTQNGGNYEWQLV